MVRKEGRIGRRKEERKDERKDKRDEGKEGKRREVRIILVYRRKNNININKQ